MGASDVMSTTDKEAWILHAYIRGVLRIKADMSRVLGKGILQAQGTPPFKNHCFSA